MRKIWLLFSQTVTVLLAAYFVVATLKPDWLNRRGPAGGVSVIEAPASGSVKLAAPGSFSAAAKAASGAVVSITASKTNRTPHAQDPWFRFFFGEQAEGEPQAGLGSGVIVSSSGYILTNHHVIEGADNVEVSLNDQRKARAKVVGVDPETDLAVLKIELDRLPVVVLGNSDDLEIGDQVLAIGNPFGVGQTVTSGIISALGRNQLGINVFETSSRPMPPSTQGTQAARWSTRKAGCWASTPPFTRVLAAPWALVLPSPSPPRAKRRPSATVQSQECP